MEHIPGLTFYEKSLKMFPTEIPVRSTKVSLGSSNILISPLPGWGVQDYARVGPITDIFAPNLFHHLGVRGALEANPSAALWAAPGLDLKRPRVPWSQILSPQTWKYQSEAPIFPILGVPKFNEVVLLHKASRTLVCSDLCFNLQDLKGVGAFLIFNVFGTYRQFGVSRLVRFMVKDASSVRQSLEEIVAQDFENIVMAHGRVVTQNGRNLLKAALHKRGLI